MICPQCNHDVLFFPSGEKVCVKCVEDKAENVKADRAERTKATNRKAKRKERGTVMGKFVIYHEGKWKRSNLTPPWDTFSLAHVYVSKGRADHACRMIGYGVVMERMETETETLRNHRRELMRII